MKNNRSIKIIFILILIMIIFPLIYLAYDRSLMPPKPTWTSPPYVPGETWEQYATRFIETNKKPNALSHYLKALSSASTDIPALTWRSMDTIIQFGWIDKYPEVDKLLQINQPAISEVMLGAKMQHCEMPEEPFGENAPDIWSGFSRVHILSRLMVLTGKKLEKQNRPHDALKYYLQAIRFEKDIGQNNQGLTVIGISNYVIKNNIRPIVYLVQTKKLTTSDYTRIIDELNETEQPNQIFGHAVKVNYQEFYYMLYNQTKKPASFAKEVMDVAKTRNDVQFSFPSRVYVIGYIFFNRGRILSNDYDFYNYLLNCVTTRTYREFRHTNWMPKEELDYIHELRVGCGFLHYGDWYSGLVRGITSLRLARIQAAIQLYHLEKNHWPKKIDDLKLYLSPIPVDLYTDKPFLWAQDSTGRPYAYSVGPDFKDDSAKVIYDPTNGTTSGGDIIPN